MGTVGVLVETRTGNLQDRGKNDRSLHLRFSLCKEDWFGLGSRGEHEYETLSEAVCVT
jgi:hypothetical protein